MIRRLALGGLIVGMVWGSAQAIVGRHDVDLVAEKKEARRFRAVCKILPDGEGVLIAPRWVLTAAHVGEGAPAEALRVQLGGVDYRVASVQTPKGWRPGRGDVALLELTTPVPYVEPLSIHDGPLEVGAPVWLAGRGDFGDGEKGVRGNDGALRIADNEVERLEQDRILIRLDAPDEGARPREGISGPGDSGTPLLVEIDGSLRVVGIGSVGSSPDGKRYGQYGSLDVFIRLSAFREWLETALEGGVADP